MRHRMLSPVSVDYDTSQIRSAKLSTDRIMAIQNECFADDIVVDYQLMRFATEAEAKAFFESGGQKLPANLHERAGALGRKDGSTEPMAFHELERYRVWAMGGASVYASPNVASDRVLQLARGSALLAMGSLRDASGRLWLKICDPDDGYVDHDAAECKEAFDNPRTRFELTRLPAMVLPEPPRDATADTTFTCTFNGRLQALFEAVGSVLHELGGRRLRRIDSWVIIADQGASHAQRLEVQKVLPWATFISKGAALGRHPVSMNLLGPFVRTRWWLMWEDDWALPSGSGDVLERAIDVARHGGFHQVAMNGSWLQGDGAWGTRGAPDAPVQHTPDGTAYVRVEYPADDRRRVLQAGGTLPATQALASSYIAGVQPELRGREPPLMWPLYSNQPSLNDARFLLALLPFEEAPAYNAPRQYWLFEFEYALRFVRAGGRKATMPGHCARQLPVKSSSR